uniref:DUF7745 domain-containing protein n=1 Tax=Fagus sylvatica TaxID=28930 RepID=A0A2N9EZZ7_FAGSY
MASSSGNPNSLVTLRFHDFCVERMRHWWTLLGEDDHASIVGVFGKFASLMRLQVDHGLLEALASFWDPTHCCFSVGEVDLIPAVEEYAGLLQLDSPFSETPVIPIQSPRSNRVLEKYLGLTSAVLRSEIIRPEETWQKANIPLDLLTKYFSWSDFPVELAGDFIARKKGWKKFRVNAFKIAFAGIFLFPTSAGRIDLGVIPLETGRGDPDVLHTASSALVLQSLAHFPSPATVVTGRYILLDLPLSEWSWKVTWGPAVWIPWTHCALFDGVPLPGVWGCTSYYPNLALRQFGGVQYPPRLGDLSAVTFDYVLGEDMWRLLFRIEDIWGGRLSEMVLIEGGLHADSSVTPDFVEWREGWSPSFTLRPTIRPGASYSSVSHSLQASTSTGRLRERSLRLVWSPCGAPLHQSNAAVANLRRDLEVQRGNVSTLRVMNDFTREQLEISEAAKDHLEQTLAETQGQLETEQVERTRVQDELDSLHSYTQALVDPSTGRPHDIVALRRALDESEAALTSARTSMGAMQGSDQRPSGREGFPVVTALHQVNQVMDSLGARGSRRLGGA